MLKTSSPRQVYRLLEQSVSRITQRVNASRRTSLRTLLVLPLVLQVFTIAWAIAELTTRNSRSTVTNLAHQLMEETSDRIHQRLDRYLSISHQLNIVNATAIELGILDSQDFDRMGLFFWKQMQSFGLDYIAFGYPNGEFIGAGQLEDGTHVIDEMSYRRTNGDRYGFSTTPQGDRVAVINVFEDWDHRLDPNYTSVLRTGEATWSQIYKWQDDSETLAISAGHPVFNNEGMLLGVLTIDHRLEELSFFLSQLSIGEQGRAFILERNGQLVASSVPMTPSRDRTSSRIMGISHPDPLIQATVAQLQTEFDSFHRIQNSVQLSFIFNGRRDLVHIEPFQDEYGLDWLIVVVIPQDDFMAQVNENTRLTMSLILLAIAIALVISLLLARWLVRPILKTIYAVDALSRGNWKERLPNDRTDELGVLACAFNRMADQLQQSFAQLHQAAYCDALTGLPNRAALIEALTDAIADVRLNSDKRFALLFLDLDGFKLVNDSLGHLTGDRLLNHVATRICQQLKNSAIAARFGGDEFAILLPSIQTISDATAIADKILNHLSTPFRYQDYEMFISASIGIVMSTSGGTTPEHFLRDADTAMYHAKQSGKGCYEVFDTTMHLQTVSRLQLETDLRYAIDRKEFEVYYQPIFEAQTGQMAGLEALLRWHHPTQGMISPDCFIPIAEETGLITPIGYWVLEQSCRQMSEWRSLFPTHQHLVMSVNLSSQQLFQADLLEQIRQILYRTHLSSRHLKLEITENTVMNNVKIAGAKLRRLRTLGIQLSIDDFGTGYSSLSYLHRFPFNTLKIDRMFIHQATLQPESWDIAKTIIVLGHRLGMDIVAEGVETAEQAEQLRRLGCEYLQGYLFSRPVTASAIAEQLAQV
jgi:diguanylate cyclase (GGDEF)-like protein